MIALTCCISSYLKLKKLTHSKIVRKDLPCKFFDQRYQAFTIQLQFQQLIICYYKNQCNIIIKLYSSSNYTSIKISIIQSLNLILQIMKYLLLSLLLVYLISASAITSQVSLALTIYDNQFAIVKDVRSIIFDKGQSDIYFTDVSPNIQPETVTFNAVSSPVGIRIFEQNYEANLQISYKYNGTLVGYNNGYILQTPNGIQLLNKVQGVKFPSLPSGVFTLPSLSWNVFSNDRLTSNCQVAYRTSGFSWKLDYSVILNENETKADIGGWVSIDNRSGKRYLNATIKLMAGDVNAAQDRLAFTKTALTFSEKSFSDYHMYTLSHPISLNHNSKKQVEFIPKVYGVNIRKYNLVAINTGRYDQTQLKASNKIEITNSKKNDLGIPLPKGTVRVFKQDDSDGSLEFIGEDSIKHTPKDENITLNIGNSFDITANKYVTNTLTFGREGYSTDANLTVFNHKQIAAEIVIELNIYYDSNLRMTWKTQGLNIQTVSSSLLRIKRVFAANEKFSFLWTEDYRP